MVVPACRPVSVATTVAASAIATRPGARGPAQHEDDECQQSVAMRTAARSFTPTSGITGEVRCQGVQQDRQRHVPRAGVVLAVKNRRIQLAVPCGIRNRQPDALVVADAVVVVDVQSNQSKPSGQNCTGQEPQRYAHRPRQHPQGAV